MQGNSLVFQRPAWSPSELSDEHDILLFCRYNKGDRVPGGSQRLKVIMQGESLEGNDLNPRSKEIIRTIKRKFRLPV
jgi:hypothetical protein